MSTTVTIRIVDQHRAFITKQPEGTEITITRASKAQAITEAITMVTAAHRAELEQGWTELRAQVEQLLQVHRDMTAPADAPAAAQDDAADATSAAAERPDEAPHG